MMQWTKLSPDSPPPDGVLLDCITASGDQRQLIYDNGLFWLPDRSMYVYFTPAVVAGGARGSERPAVRGRAA
jgi:hypothetical protein